jgi:hypothetical protein
MQPSDLHYEKAEPVPGWDKSLWPERGRWRLNVRLARWSDLVTALLTALMVLALGGWITVVSLTELDLIVVPDFLAYRPRRAPLGSTRRRRRLRTYGNSLDCCHTGDDDREGVAGGAESASVRVARSGLSRHRFS